MTLNDEIAAGPNSHDKTPTGKLRILYITQFFPPELGAAANRARNFVKIWSRNDAEVTVVCQVPHYPTGNIPDNYQERRVYREKFESAMVIRVPAVRSASGSSLYRKLYNQTTFFLNTITATFKTIEDKFDIVFATTPPIWNTISGYKLHLKYDGKLVLDIRDTWPEVVTLDDKYNILWGIAARITTVILHRFYRRASMLVSPVKPILDYLSEFFDMEKLWIPNGVLFKELELIKPYPRKNKKFTVIYSGLLGRLQGTQILFDYARKLPDVEFWVIGDGIDRPFFMENRLPNLKYWGTMPWHKTISLIKAADLGLVLLKNDSPWLKMALPSKSMEYLALGKPVVVNNDGFLASLLREYGAGEGFPHDAVEPLINFIKLVASNRELYDKLSRNALRLARDKFDMSKNALKLLEAFRELKDKER